MVNHSLSCHCSQDGIVLWPGYGLEDAWFDSRQAKEIFPLSISLDQLWGQPNSIGNGEFCPRVKWPAYKVGHSPPSGLKNEWNCISAVHMYLHDVNREDFDYILITNLMHWLLFIHKILFSSTCFEPQVLIFKRIQLYTCSLWYCHSLWEFLVACRNRAQAVYWQEDTVVYMQPMELSLSMRVPGGLSVHSLSCVRTGHHELS